MTEDGVAVASGIGLAVTSVAYYVARRASLAGSGHLSRLVDALWRKKNEDELIAAVMAATAARFGAEAMERVRKAPAVVRSNSVTLLERAVFLLAIAIGGAISQRTDEVRWSLDPAFAGLVGGGSEQAAALLVAGVLVGFGARLAGGCTTGHGLVGVSQLQKGSLVSTSVMFAAGVATTLLLR